MLWESSVNVPNLGAQDLLHLDGYGFAIRLVSMHCRLLQRLGEGGRERESVCVIDSIQLVYRNWTSFCSEAGRHEGILTVVFVPLQWISREAMDSPRSAEPTKR